MRPSLIYTGVLAMAAFLAGFFGPTLLGRGAGGPGTGALPPVAPAMAQAEEPPAPPAAREPAAPEPAAPEPEPAPTPVPPEQRLRIPILMYHELGDGPNNLYVRLSEFRAQLAYLQEAGYHPVTFDQAHRHLAEGAPLPEKPVVITFDDGYASFYTRALPLLREHGYPATLFVVTGFFGRANYVTWDQVREMAAAGIEIGSHTITHRDLRSLGQATLQRELTGAREELARQLGHEVGLLAYPLGRHDDRVVQAALAAGYRAAVTTSYGAATHGQNPLLYSRVRIWRGQTLAGFARQLAEASGQGG